MDHEAPDSAASELVVSRRQVYALVARWCAGEGVVSDLPLRRASNGRGEVVMQAVLRRRYLTKSAGRLRRCIAEVTLVRRVDKLDPTVSAREGTGAGPVAAVCRAMQRPDVVLESRPAVVRLGAVGAIGRRRRDAPCLVRSGAATRTVVDHPALALWFSHLRY